MMLDYMQRMNDDSQDSQKSSDSNSNDSINSPEPRIVQHGLDKSDNSEQYKGVPEQRNE